MQGHFAYIAFRLHPMRGVSAAWLARVRSGGLGSSASRTGGPRRLKSAIPALAIPGSGAKAPDRPPAEDRKMRAAKARVSSGGSSDIRPRNTACGRSGQVRPTVPIQSRLFPTAVGWSHPTSRATLRLRRTGNFGVRASSFIHYRRHPRIKSEVGSEEPAQQASRRTPPSRVLRDAPFGRSSA